MSIHEKKDISKFSDEIFKQLQDEIDLSGKMPGSLDELNDIARKAMDRHNNAPLEDFEGLSSNEMFMIINRPFESGCPVVFRSGPDIQIVEGSPVMRVYSLIASYLREESGIKLTPKGNLPRKIVSGIFALDLYTKEEKRYHPSKVLNEDDYIPAAYTRALMKAAGLVTIRHNMLSLTKKGISVKDKAVLYRDLFKAFTGRFHIGYLDGYESESIGNLGILYVLYLLKRYGSEKREAEFYAERYFSAFPSLVNEIQPTPYRDAAKSAIDCFNYRVFEKGLFLFGLIESEYEGQRFDRKLHVKASEIFKQLF